MMEELRAHVTAKLQELDGVIGLRQTAEGTAPYLFQKGDDLSQLEIGPRYPLATVVSLLQKRYPESRFGIVARGCDARALVEMAKREQVDPDRLYLLGVACTAEEAEECHCADPAPDPAPWPQAEVIGTPVEGASPNPVVADYEGMSLKERREFWQQQLLKCIKCYGCRNICPVCYCKECTLEDADLVPRGIVPPAAPAFHFIKAIHMADRCIDCGLCEETCPSHIPLRTIYRHMRKTMHDLFDYVPGEKADARSPLVALEEGGRLTH